MMAPCEPQLALSSSRTFLNVILTEKQPLNGQIIICMRSLKTVHIKYLAHVLLPCLQPDEHI